MLPSLCSRASCAYVRYLEITWRRPFLYSLAVCMPVRLEVFLQFSFSNIVFMFLLYYTRSVFRSRNSRKAFKFLSKRLVLLLCGNQYRHLCFVYKTTYLWSMRSAGGGELSLSACPGVGSRPPSENKIANFRGYARGGW